MEATTRRLMNLAPFGFKRAIDRMLKAIGGANKLEHARRDLESVALRAAILAAYTNERGGWGYGDRGHARAVKAANKAGRKVWCGVFGYDSYIDLTI